MRRGASGADALETINAAASAIASGEARGSHNSVQMRRGANGADALETINAAASAIASGETRGYHASVQKRKWGSFWSLYWCFGWNKNKRIGHFASESSNTRADAPTAEYASQQTSVILPFVAPPSSPTSFLFSEPPSATQSPTGILSLTSVSANMNSPGPASMFTIGPYAHETQLVSPPVFSTFTTEPSTAPYTPPPESVHHMTTPSSPEVPFARLLDPTLQNGGFSNVYEFQPYQLQPGSPVSHLISPSSGTSSPFPDREFAAAHPFFLQFTAGNNQPKLLDLDKILKESGKFTPDAHDSCKLNRQNSDVAPLPHSYKDDDGVVNHRVSFEITDEEVVRCVEKSSSPSKSIEGVKHAGAETSFRKADCEYEPPRHQKNRTITLGSTKEFNFENVEGGNSSEWWTKEKVAAEDEGHSKNWSFFPMMQTGVS